MTRPSTPGRGQVSLRELNHHAGRVIGQVRRGVIVTVTDRGVPVATIAPHIPEDDPVQDLINRGLARPALTGYQTPDHFIDLPDGLSTADLLAADRAED